MSDTAFDWLNVYQAANPVEAELLAGMLNSQGIKAKVTPNLASGGVGELAADAMATRIQVRAFEYEMARTLLTRYEQQSTEAEWTCSTCNERQAPSFEVCWQCGEERS